MKKSSIPKVVVWIASTILFVWLMNLAAPFLQDGITEDAPISILVKIGFVILAGLVGYSAYWALSDMFGFARESSKGHKDEDASE